MDTTQFFIQQETRRYESQCQSAIQRVDMAKTMWEVRRAADVSLPATLRAIRHIINRAGAGRVLEQKAEQKMGSILDAQLKEAASFSNMDERKAFLGRLRHKEWDALRGEFPILYRKADMEGQRLLAKP